MSKNVKKRNWAMVLYPESAPTDWREKLQQTGLQCAISPLHDKDINPTGELKKAHYHIILCYDGPTSFNVVNRLCVGLNQPIPQALEQIRGYYRYLTHKDNPEKYQYDESEIVAINGFDISDYIELTKSEIKAIKRDIVGLIKANEIYEYCDLMDYLSAETNNDFFDVASSNTLFFNSYIKSRKYKKQNAE